MTDLRWRWVTCSECAAFYQRTPNTTDDGDDVCETCLYDDLPMRTITVDPVTFAVLRSGALRPRQPNQP